MDGEGGRHARHLAGAGRGAAGRRRGEPGGWATRRRGFPSGATGPRSGVPAGRSGAMQALAARPCGCRHCSGQDVVSGLPRCGGNAVPARRNAICACFRANRFRGRNCQPACKPGFVRRGGRAGPARRPFIWDARCRTPLATYPDDWPGNRPDPGGSASSLFGLAPGGVYHAVPVAGSAVGSYPTLSPLPARRRAVCFLWHFPWGRPRRALPGTVSPWSPDFPPRHPFGPCRSGRPAGWRAFPSASLAPGKRLSAMPAA